MNKNSYEFIAAAVYSSSVSNRLNTMAEEQARTATLKFVNKSTGADVEAEEVLAIINESGQLPEIEPTGNDIADDLILSATLLQLHGYKKQAINLLKHANYQLLYNRIEAEKIKNIETVIKLSRQKAIAKKPRNPHYNEALRIAKATWERYPCAAKGPLCRNLRKHFNGKVSVDRLDVWIKEAELQPPRPERYTSFVLVTE